jgi:hypothetical protein
MAANKWHPRNPFPLVMRGYEPRAVDTFLTQLDSDAGVPVPDFPRVMRGYDPRYVDERIQELRQQGA